MNNNKMEIIILKLGGSLITEKDKPLSINEKIIKDSIEQIIKSKKKVILVHGGGSFGHPTAKKYDLRDGKKENIESQIYGLTETHYNMTKLNSYIINSFLEKNYPAIEIQSSSIFKNNSTQISKHSIEIIEDFLDLGIIPILYGDIVLDDTKTFSILSGDEIIFKLCQKLMKYTILKVIFAADIDGIYIGEKDGSTHLASKIPFEELKNLSLANLGNKIDVTNGIKGKLEQIRKISQLGIPVEIINGTKSNLIYKSLNNEKIKSTFIEPIEKEIKGIKKRKLDHILISLNKDVKFSENYFDYIKLIHNAYPEVNLNQIDLTTDFYGRKISAPICISAITGGNAISKKINKILAQAAEQEKIILGVGSQRAGIDKDDLIDSFKVVRQYAPSIPIIGNIGIGQISDKDFKLDDFSKCIEMINADVMAIHFNALHELVQKNGDVTYDNFSKNFQKIRNNFEIPIIAKEVGCGFNYETAKKLDKMGFDGFDIGGAGGTSFSKIEFYRSNEDNQLKRSLSKLFGEWGVPTPISIKFVRKVTNKPIIATGGLRNGMDILKSLFLGADFGGFASKFLNSAWKDLKNSDISNTTYEIKQLKNELKSSMWLTNTKDLNLLKKNMKKYILMGKIKEWLIDSDQTF